MAEPENAIFHIVAGDRIVRGTDRVDTQQAEPPIEPGLYTGLSEGAVQPVAAATVRSVGLEMFPEPESYTDRIKWLDGPPAALVEFPDELPSAASLTLADSTGELFEVSHIQQLTAIPSGRLHVLHRPPSGAATFDIVLLSEGYTVPEHDEFLADAKALTRAFLEIEPYRACRDRLRVAALFLPCPATGITETNCGGAQHHDHICRANNQTRSTLFGTRNMVASYCRLIAGNEDRVREALKANHITPLLAHEGITPRLAVVVGNTEVYGGAGAVNMGIRPLVAWTAPTQEGGAVMAHEMGHALGLQDEYEDSGTSLPNPNKWINISDSADPSGTPWHCRATDRVGPFPTCEHHNPTCGCEPSLIGTFEGAGYKSNDRYRPTKNCGMRTTGAPFCPICSAHIANRLSGNQDALCPPP